MSMGKLQLGLKERFVYKMKQMFPIGTEVRLFLKLATPTDNIINKINTCHISNSI